MHACASLNVRDVNNVKFFENRANGQSKGYCAIDVASLNSAKTLMHELRNVLVIIVLYLVVFCIDRIVWDILTEDSSK